MARDAALVRAGKPFCFTNCRTGVGIDQVMLSVLEGVGVISARL
jgi:Ni2+-binding GTPase involved in maturation of urease and hydrogenase